MNILVLGGSGYLGSKIVNRLLMKDNQVTGTKRLLSDVSRVKATEIKWIPASADAIETAVKYNVFDCVINAACIYGKGNELDESVLEANMQFPLRVLNKAAEGGIKKFITIGTGLPDDLNLYSFSKKVFSEFGRFYAKKYGMSFYSMQLEMFYGADEPENRFLPTIIRKMICGEEVNLTMGTQKRDIIAVEDVINAVLMILDSKKVGYCEIPVGTGTAPAILEIANFIWNETGKRSKLNMGAVPMRENEPDCVADVSELKKLGEWEPMNWKTGLHGMIKEIEEGMCGVVHGKGRMA